MTSDGTTLKAATVEADLTELVTNESRRDARARDALGTNRFPKATFTLTSPVELGDAATSGGKVTVTATGNLTVHGVTKPVQVAIEAQQSGNTIVVVGSMPVVFSDYAVSVPKAPFVLSADDHGTIELQLLFTKSS